jgi:hypothetical protein
MTDRSFVRKRRIWSALLLAALSCMVSYASVSAQQTSPGDEGGSEAERTNEPMRTVELDPQRMPGTIGGGPELIGSYNYTSPLEKFGTDLLVASYALNVLISIGYLAVVYPLGKLFGDATLNPVFLWMFVPIVGPFFAQYTDAAKSKPILRAVLIGDSVLQATGLVVGLIGLALSGRREHHAAARSGVELKLGVEGAGLTGLTLCVRTL